jgi:tRNA-splicing ligase RtcB
MDLARQSWPTGRKHPAHGLYGLSGPLARQYLQAMGVAARFAWFNRMALGELVRQALADWAADSASRLVVDVPHNVVLHEHGLNVHRKGATPAHAGQLALIPGSMGDFSYLATGLPGWQCVTLREERRIEEAPSAYKPVGPVIAAQEAAGLIRAAVRLRPWMTFKA